MTARTWPVDRTRLLVAGLLLSVLTLGLSPSAPSTPSGADRLMSVIVQSFTGSSTDARAAVESVGGEVTRDLSIINGVSAKVPADELARLRSQRGLVVTKDSKVGFHGGPDASLAQRIQKVVNAQKVWNNGYDGSGVTVALIDTGVYNHPDLNGRVICGADFTAEAAGPANCEDTFGHGTFMAGLIAGNGASSNGKYSGSAPSARIVSVKAAGGDGSTDVSTILASIQWVVAHQAEYDIRALNLSLGTDASTDYRLSPLNFAVEKAWQSGITVVVSAGNTGPDSSTVMKPGDDPYVITVGASNDEGSVSIGDDRVPVFSGRGPTRANGLAKPDVVSPGVHTVSLRAPGSAVDQQFGSTATVDGAYFRGSGTSMSTATVTGIVADILDRNPNLTPNQVKYRLTATARTIADADPNMSGAGIVDAFAATMSNSVLSANTGLTPSTGLGSLQLDRGTLGVDVVTPAGQIVLAGEYAAQLDPNGISVENPTGLVPYVAGSYTTSGWDATSWHATSWHNETWSATSWHGTSWHATSWHDGYWDATSWHDGYWDATSWHNADWDATSWHATSWHDFDWDATSWHATSWHSTWYAVAWD